MVSLAWSAKFKLELFLSCFTVLCSVYFAGHHSHYSIPDRPNALAMFLSRCIYKLKRLERGVFLLLNNSYISWGHLLEGVSTCSTHLQALHYTWTINSPSWLSLITMLAIIIISVIIIIGNYHRHFVIIALSLLLFIITTSA